MLTKTIATNDFLRKYDIDVNNVHLDLEYMMFLIDKPSSTILRVVNNTESLSRVIEECTRRNAEFRL